MPIVDIVIPAYGALGPLRRCVDSVLASRCEAQYEIIIVNDATDDAEFMRYLHDLASSGRATIIEQSARQGYAAARESRVRPAPRPRCRDLQSDAEVANDWLDRLVRPRREAGYRRGRDVHQQRGRCDVPAAAQRQPVAGRPHGNHAGRAVRTRQRRRFRAAACRRWPLSLFPARLLERRRCLRCQSAGQRTTASKSTFACARAARVTATRSPVMSSSRTKDMHRSARATRKPWRNAPKRRWPSSIPPTSRRRRNWPSTSRGVRFARRVDLLRLAESGKRLLVFVSHPWGGGIRRYMNDLVALTDARCEVLYLEPAVGHTVKLSWPQAGRELRALLHAAGRNSRCSRRRCARSASSACTSTTSTCSRARSWNCPR